MEKAEKKNIKKQIEAKEKELLDKAKELGEKHKVQVHPFLFLVSDNDFCIGFIKEPTFYIKKQALDASLRSLTDAGQLILDSCIIQDESDQRIWCEDAEEKYPEIRMGAIMKAQEFVKYFSDLVKKK